MAGLGSGVASNQALGQGESDAVFPSAQRASASVGSQESAAGKSMRERSEPTVTGAAMHVALFVPRN